MADADNQPDIMSLYQAHADNQPDIMSLCQAYDWCW